MNILYFDLENTPIFGTSWSTYQTNLLSIEKDSELLSVAYKINDGPTDVMSRRLYTERQLAKKLWKLFDNADVIVAQNGDAFDIKVANKFFVKYKLKPPSPYKTVDTLKLARKYFKFPSNKLDYLAEAILGGRKLSTGGIDLWFKCMKGDKDALIQMEKYNVHDVDLLYDLYHAIKQWHTGHPNHNVFNGTTHQCPNCGGNTQKRGFMVTRADKYQRYQCTSCGAWSKGERIKMNKVLQ
jgi:predicted RNA-binding Zn-ribbon protein involved in translation (DUF1610 family)/DNA polymerase elongation subunit (family B)